VLAALQIHAQMARDILTRTGELPPVELCERIARVCIALGEAEIAVALIAAVRERLLQTRSRSALRTAQHLTFVLVQLCVRAGDSSSGEAFLDAAGESDTEPLDEFERRLCQAMLHAANGRFASAIELYDRCLVAVPPLATRYYALGDVQLRRAQALFDGGRFAEVEQCIEAELRVRPSAELTLIKARLQVSRAEYSAARASFASAASQATGDDPEGLAIQARLGLVSSAMALNRLRDAEQELETLRAQGADDPRLDAALLERLAGYVRARRSARIQDLDLPFFPEQIFEGGGAGLRSSVAATREDETQRLDARRSERLAADCNALANRALVALARGDTATATRLVTGLRSMLNGTDSAWLTTRADHTAAIVCYQAGDLERARELAQRALSFAEREGLWHEAWKSATIVNNCDARLFGSRGRAEAAEEANRLLFKVADGLSASDRAFYLLNKWFAVDEYAASLLGPAVTLGEPATGSWWRARCERAKQGRCLHRVRERLGTLYRWDIHADSERTAATELRRARTPDEIEVWVEDRLAELGSRRSASRLSGLLAWLRKLRAPRQAVLEYHVLPDRIYVFVATSTELKLLCSDTTRVQLDELVADLREALDPQREDPMRERALCAVTRELAQALLLPRILEMLPNAPPLAVVPSDVLVNVPWPLLVRAGAAATRPSPLTILPRTLPGGALPTLRWRRPERPLVVAISAFGDAEDPLPSAAIEGAAIATELGDSALGLFEAQARLESVTAAMLRADWVHFATHGHFDTSSPADSYLSLADGALRARALSRLDLRHLRGVVISACESAGRAALPGGETLGLPATLLHAGVPCVIAPLWPVEDAVSLRFMQDLYRELARCGPARALANVQHHWSEQQDVVRRSPRSWAGYLVQGGVSV
jgi:CHAT domain-containing protein